MIPPATKGLLLVNLGTPDAPTPSAVRRYLSEFLWDERVIDLPAWGRWLFLNLIILPLRPRRSAAAYQKIWTERGSPLLFHSLDCTRLVSEALRGEYKVAFGMRYGNPSLSHALGELRRQGVQELTVLPLYPQNAASSTSSSLARVYELLRAEWEVLPVRVIPPFFDHPSFLSGFAQSARTVIDRIHADHVLFSFHGLPERQVKKSDASGRICLASPTCCDQLTLENRTCYRAESFHVARTVATQLGLPKEGFTVSFQSRLGRTEWVKPYTDLILPELAGRGVKRLAVVCPAFVADCLETLEEIGIRARETFLQAGGEQLELVPSLNSNPAWAQGLVDMVRRTERAPS